MTDKARPEKICVRCGQDCAGQPRTKDAKGRYYHTSCYEEAKRAMEARKAADAAAAPPPPPPPPAPEEEIFDVLGAAVDEMAPPPGAPAPMGIGAPRVCPNCGGALAADALICTTCGYNLQTRKQLKSKKRKAPGEPGAGMGGLIEFLVSPMGIGLGVLVFFGIFFALALANESAALAYIGLASLFEFGVWITVLVFAFIEGIGQGLLTLCVPCYILYFVFGVCENQYVKVLFALAILSNVAGLFLQSSMNIGYFAPTF